MSDDPNNNKKVNSKPAAPAAQDELEEEDALLRRFPAPPQVSFDAPAPPKIKVDLPPHPDAPKPGAPEPGSYRNTALATQVASSFFMPIVILMLLGWLADKQFHTGGIAIVLACILGLVVGVVNMLRISNKMNDEPPFRKR